MQPLETRTDTHTEALGYESSPEQARALAACEAGAQYWELELRVPLDEAQVRGLLARVAERHELLRTRLTQVCGLERPVQVVGDALAKELELSVEPSAGRSRVLLRVPFALLDEAGCLQLACELAAAASGDSSQTDVLQYADYAAYRNEQLARAAEGGLGERLRSARAGFMPLRGRVARLSAEPARRQALEHDARLHARCAELAQTLGCTTPELLACAFAWLVRRHADEASVTLAIDWQVRPDYAQGALGRFLEPLPVEIPLDPELRLEGVARKLQTQLAELLALREQNAAAHDPRGYACGFRYLPLTNEQRAQLRAADFELRSIASPLTFCALLLEVCGDERDFRLSFEYAASRYDARALSVLADQLYTLLGALCTAPDAPLGRHALSSAAEQRALAQLSAAPDLERAAELLYAQVAHAPGLAHVLARNASGACEVLSEHQRLSGAELSARADAVAAALRARGLAPGQVVGQLMPREAEAVAVMLGILRAGGVYLPLDPQLPAARIAALLADADAAYCVSRRSLWAAADADERWLWLEDVPVLTSPERAASRDVRGELAYIIYTSGSTGQPKGVPITHAAALHSLAARLAYYPLPVERFLLVSPLSFDSSLAGLFASLAQGRSLYVCNEAEARDPARLAELLEGHTITHWLALPSLVQAVLPELASRRCALHLTIVAGEACSPELLELHRRVLPQARLYNEYGPTEAAIWSSVADCTQHERERPVSIGRSIPHARLYVLDAAGAPAPRGVPGEIFVGGPGLSPGYVKRPELTEERFVSRAGERLYRTGDRAYLDERGECVFLGRSDGQIKLRGHRVELGEIEAALAAVSGSANVVVLAHAATGGESRLRAFVESAPETSDVRAWLAALSERLPDYMLPRVIEVLPRLPRTVSGKLDRRALEGRPPPREAAPYAPPVGALEKLLCRHIAELLGIPHVGRHDDFFALGGHSLLVVRLAHQLREAAGIELRVSQVFEHPTVARLVAALDRPAPHGLCELSAGDGPDARTLFCFHESRGDVHYYFSLLPQLPASLRVLGVPLPEGVDPLDLTLEQLVDRYTRQVRAVAPCGPYALCGYSLGGVLAHAVAARLEAAGERVSFLGLFDASLERGVHAFTFDALWQLVRGELHPDSVARFDALPVAARDELRARSASLGVADQLQYALREFAPRHGLSLLAPPEIIAAVESGMRYARHWLDGYRAPQVAASIEFFASATSLEQSPKLIAQWSGLTRGVVRSAVFPVEHGVLLSCPELQLQFAAALAQVGTP